MPSAKKIYDSVKNKKNVIGYSREVISYYDEELKKKVPTVVVYVAKKEPLEYLKAEDVVPRYLEGHRLKLVEIGEITLLDVDRASRIRPVVLGLSVGHHDITAGSLGHPFLTENGLVYGSNAHVLTPDSGMKPEEIKEKRIYQPGPYHGKTPDENICGEYLWHKQVFPAQVESPCPISKGIVAILNFIFNLLRRNTKFSAYQEKTNHIDFAVYIPKCDHKPHLPDGMSYPGPFIGLLFAGSNKVGVICKAKYMKKEGFVPYCNASEVRKTDVVWGCSFWGDYETTVQDASATVQVSYGQFTAVFEDVILVKNESVIKGGWSGSGWYLKT